MPSITVRHQSLESNWLSPEQIENPRTLVLGSFNPSNGDNHTDDYYYGRKSNHFWRTIANIIGQQEDYFFDVERNPGHHAYQHPRRPSAVRTPPWGWQCVRN